MELTRPTKRYEKSFQQALLEFDEAGVSGFWNAREALTDIERYIVDADNHSNGVSLPPGWVKNTTLWLIDNAEFIGHVNIRHELTDALRQRGGHIGYAIRPSKQRQGYGHKILELALPHAKEIGIDHALVTADKDHEASRKIIERNGGVFHEEGIVDGVPIVRYKIKL